MYVIVQKKHVVFVNHFCKLIWKFGLNISDFIFRRPQQARQPGAAGGAGGAAGGQGNTGAGGHRGGGNKQALQPVNIPVSKSMFSVNV